MVTLQALRRDARERLAERLAELLASRAWFLAYFRSSPLMTVQLTVRCKVSLFVECQTRSRDLCTPSLRRSF